jgi:hypothetical protein
MNRLLKTVLAVSAAALLGIPLVLVPPKPVKANGAVMCQGDVSGASTGSRTVGGTLSSVPSGTLYTLSGNGCAYVQAGDIGYFLSQGYTSSGNLGTPLVFTTGVQTGTTDIVLGTIPASSGVVSVGITNSTANAVTGGISIGSTANGTQIAAAITCGANCVVLSPVLAATYSATAATTIHAAAVTAWNSANVAITVNWSYF